MNNEEGSLKMMRSGYNQVSPSQEHYPQSISEYWGGYQQPMPYPQPSNQEPYMYPYPPQGKGGYMPTNHDPYQQAAYHPFQQMQQQVMPVGALSRQQCNAANAAKQPMPQCSSQCSRCSQCNCSPISSNISLKLLVRLITRSSQLNVPRIISSRLTIHIQSSNSCKNSSHRVSSRL